jgi:ParB/RepB/Spo0J family partition protein
VVTGKRIGRENRSDSPPDPDAAKTGAVIPDLRDVPIEQVDVPSRPARRFLGDIAALADSMQEYGLQQPISVREKGERFALTSGLRRLTAARMLNWQVIPAFVRRIDEDQAYLLDLIENLQREDLSPEEEADALRELIRTRGWTLQQLAEAVKRSIGYISKRVRVFDDPLLRRAVEHGLPVSTAEELLAADSKARLVLIERAISEHWDQTRARQEIQSVIQTEVSADSAARLAESTSMPERHGPELPRLGRPRGLTRAIREFHQLIARVEPVQLTQADRAGLRSLYRDLTLLARAPITPRAPMFPPLPALANERRRTRAVKRRGRAGRRRG